VASRAIQGTKPQTIGIALNDSPVGLAAWIVEKFQSWCDCDGNPETIFAKDDLLANISLYWFTQTAASSARIYYEQEEQRTRDTEEFGCYRTSRDDCEG
jgi:microsomal epoxide hydrolase